MKTQGRPKSSNIEDKRAYFGSNSVKDSSNPSFRQESFNSARTFKGGQSWNKFSGGVVKDGNK